MTPLIVLDIDGVLADFLGPYQHLLRGFGAPVKEGEPAEWHFDRPHEAARQRAWSLIHGDPSWWRHLPLHRDLQAEIPRLREGYRWLALSARPGGSLSATEDWLDWCVAPLPTICADHEDNKVALLRTITPWALVDDHPGILEAVPDIPQRILVSRAYNQRTTPEGVVRVPTTSAALEYLYAQ